jgi:hypothetical protein
MNRDQKFWLLFWLILFSFGTLNAFIATLA